MHIDAADSPNLSAFRERGAAVVQRGNAGHRPAGRITETHNCGKHAIRLYDAFMGGDEVGAPLGMATLRLGPLTSNPTSRPSEPRVIHH